MREIFVLKESYPHHRLDREVPDAAQTCWWLTTPTAFHVIDRKAAICQLWAAVHQLGEFTQTHFISIDSGGSIAPRQGKRAGIPNLGGL